MQNNTEKTRILRIITRMNVGGPSHHIVNLTAGLNDYGFETILVSGLPKDIEGDMLYLAKEKQIELETIAFLNRPISPIDDLIAFIKIVAKIKQFKPQIVHTHTAKAGFLGRLAALLCGVPQIYHTYHGHIFKGYFSKPISNIIVAIERIFAAFSTGLIAISPKQSVEIQEFLKLKDATKIKTIPLGLNLEKNLATPRKSSNWRKRVGLSEHCFLLGIVARLVPIKNHALLLGSMKNLCQKIPDIHLAIIGSGELEDNLRQQCSLLGITDRVHFCGIVNDMENVYSDLDLLVLCSKNEGTPVVIIEAIASGCPVVSTNVGGVADILKNEKFGRLLSQQTEEFTNQLLLAIEDIQNGKFNEYPTHSVRQEIVRRYSVASLARNIANMYNSKK